MLIFIASWAMMFAMLFVANGWLRARAPVWPPAGQPHVPLGLPALNTLVLALSSAALHTGMRAVRAGRARELTWALVAALLLGTLFLALQILVWRGLYVAGLRPQSGAYASVFYGLTGLHAAHVAVGLVAFGWLTWRAARGAFSAAWYLPVRLWAVYWHGVAVIWAFVFVLVCW